MAGSITQQGRLLGEEVWFRTPYNNMNSGIVEEYTDNGRARIMVTSVDGRNAGGVAHVRMDDIYMDKADLISANYEEYKSRVEAYEAKMGTLEDLMKFCYGSLAKEPPEARAAMHRRTMELLGIEVDPEGAELDRKLAEADDPLAVAFEAVIGGGAADGE